MIRAAMLTRLGVDTLDDNSLEVLSTVEKPGAVMWVSIIRAPPGAVVSAFITRYDPARSSDTLFAMRASPRDGRHQLDQLMLGADDAVSAPLAAACDFMRAVRDAIEADGSPDLAGLAPLHLGVAYREPPWPPPSTPLEDGGFNIEIWC